MVLGEATCGLQLLTQLQEMPADHQLLCILGDAESVGGPAVGVDAGVQRYLMDYLDLHAAPA